jgi:acetyl-CoA C-acetyltransferase
MEAFIYDAVRTPRGRARPDGALAGVKPIDLLAGLFRSLEERTALDTARVDDIVLGCNTQTGEQGADIAKIASLYAGWDHNPSGATLNRFCCSGLDALATAAAKVDAGVSDLVVAGGVESMSRVPMLSDAGPWFADPEVAAVTGFVHMGISADLVATVSDISRGACDAFACESHARAGRAGDEGRFDRSLAPVRDGEGEMLLDRDEGIRDGMTIEKLAALPPAFAEMAAAGMGEVVRSRHPEVAELQHVHTVATAPQMVDAASLLLVGSRAAGEALGLPPRARIAAAANASVEPLMLTAPAPATLRALERARMTVGDVDLFEMNESFAAVAIEYMRRLGLEPDQVNPNGGAIAMGHPLGATGGILTMTLLDELERRNMEVGVVAIPGGAGIGAAMVVERV